MDLPADWVPPSGQQATQQKQIIVTPSPPDRTSVVHNDMSNNRAGWHPPTPDHFPSPSTALTSSGQERVRTWTSLVGISPRGSIIHSSDGPVRKKRRLPDIQKLSNIEPGQLPDSAKDAHRPLKMQSNGLALPQKVIFDPWNACTTGHQRAENRLSGSISWRESREKKLKVQLADTSGSGGRRMYDTVGAGSENFGKDGRKENGGWERGASGLRKGGQQSIIDCFVNRSRPRSASSAEEESLQQGEDTPKDMMTRQATTLSDSDTSLAPMSHFLHISKPHLDVPTSQIFQNTCIYINGSTYPLISDHVLRQLIIRHGGALSIALARRSVSHVILTQKPAHTDNDAGPRRAVVAGGGLAAGKVRKEVERKRAVGVGVKYVTAHWVIESIKAGKRLQEGCFADWRFVEPGQEDVREFFGAAKVV